MLKDFLVYLGNEVSRRIYNINFGGCCVYASIVVKNLQKKGYDAGGTVAGSCRRYLEMDIDKAREEIAIPRWKGQIYPSSWYDKGIDFDHVLVVTNIDGVEYAHDSDDTHVRQKFPDLYLAKGRLELIEMEHIYKHVVWNDMFDTKDIPYMQSLIAKEFKELEHAKI